MPHVDEGQLHAYLDRGPGDATASEWATFESHLALCEDCQARLEEARRLRDRAQEILATVGPADIEVPPFESLLARSAAGATGGGSAMGGSATGGSARGGGKRGWRSGNFPLAWAATIMVAVGAGWMARQVTMTSSEFDSLAKRPAAEAVAEPAETQTAMTEQESAISRQESVDRLEAKVDEAMVGGLAGGRANEAINTNRPAAKSVLVAEAEVGADDQVRRQADVGAEDPRARAEVARRDIADEEVARQAAREPSPLVARDLAAVADADNERKAGEALVVPATGHAALGCYELDVEWAQAGAPPLPARVRLLARAATPDPNAGEYFRSGAAGGAYELSADPPSETLPGYWVPFGSDSVLIRVPDKRGDAAVVELRLLVSEGELSGLASALSPVFADAEGAEGNAAAGAPPSAAVGSVRGRSIDCSALD